MIRILLKKDVRGIGRKGEIKNVADGYFRNFLMPHDLALPVTDQVLKKVEEEMKQKETAKAKNKSAAEKLAEKLRDYSITIKSTMDEKGHLFGSVTADIIEQELKKKGFDIKELHGKVVTDKPLKMKGVHRAVLQFPEGVTAECTVIIENSH